MNTVRSMFPRLWSVPLTLNSLKILRIEAIKTILGLKPPFVIWINSDQYNQVCFLTVIILHKKTLLWTAKINKFLNNYSFFLISWFKKKDDKANSKNKRTTVFQWFKFTVIFLMCFQVYFNYSFFISFGKNSIRGLILCLS